MGQQSIGKGATLQSPFPYFGGKSTVAHIVWQRFGDVANYVEPFFGSGAVLLARPHAPCVETVSDADSMLANFWRAVQHDPDAVAYHADYPVSEVDLHARHAWLVRQKESLTERLEGDPDAYDAKIAGWWCWGMCLWIGGEFCSGKGPWAQVDGKLVHGSGEAGVHRRLTHLGDSRRGVHKRRIHLGNHGQGVHRTTISIQGWMQALSDRLRRVRVCCGDWQRVMGPSVTFKHGITGVFLDPPYSEKAGRDNALYTHDSRAVAMDVQNWCLENGSNKLLRIALCGYQGEHEVLANHGWTPYYWKAHGGMGNTGNGKGKANREREVIWFSPHCLKDEQMMLF